MSRFAQSYPEDWEERLDYLASWSRSTEESYSPQYDHRQEDETVERGGRWGQDAVRRPVVAPERCPECGRIVLNEMRYGGPEGLVYYLDKHCGCGWHDWDDEGGV